MERRYFCFTRNWYRYNPNYYGGLQPHAGRKYTRLEYATEEEARAFCKQWNETHKPGKLSNKCEYEYR